MKPTGDGGQTLSEWKCSFDGDTARGAAETAVILDKRIVELERKVRVLGDALGVRQPAYPEKPGPTDDQIYGQFLAAKKLEELTQNLRNANQGNERLRSRVNELEADLNATRDQCDALEKQLLERDRELKSHRSRLDCNDALRMEVGRLTDQRHDLREALNKILEVTDSVRDTAEQALDD